MSSSYFYKKDLLYASYEEFIKNTEYKFDKQIFNNPKICNTLLTLFDKGNEFLKFGDDEKAYIYLVRFFEGVIELRRSKLYKEDKKYVDDFISVESLTKTMTTLEHLKQEIKIRYGERDKERMEEKKILDQVKVEPTANSESKCDVKTSVTAKEFIEFINKANQKVLVIDLRSKNEFNISHLNLNLVLNDEKKKENSITYANIPNDLIENVVWKMSESLKKHDEDISKIFESRQLYDYLILVDNDSGK